MSQAGQLDTERLQGLIDAERALIKEAHARAKQHPSLGQELRASAERSLDRVALYTVGIGIMRALDRVADQIHEVDQTLIEFPK